MIPDSISNLDYPERARMTIAAVFDTEVEAVGAALLVPGLHNQALALTMGRLAVVLDEHEQLIESWEDTPKNWKRKFLRRAINVHPKTGKCYSLPNYYEIKKVTKAGSRGVTNQSNWITQPFCLRALAG
ncbi:hypothetical protein N9L31_00025 [bacterium]|nr:hypothetical protein [bacterium]